MKKMTYEQAIKRLEEIVEQLDSGKLSLDESLKLFEESNCQAIATLHLAYSPSLEAIEPLSNTELPIVVIDTTFDYEFTAPDGIMNNHGIIMLQFCKL